MSWCVERGIPHSTLLRWDEDDRAKLMAYIMESSQECSMCGTAAWEWEADRHAYIPQVSTCWGCYFKDAANDGEDLLPGSTIVLVPRRKVEAEEQRRST